MDVVNRSVHHFVLADALALFYDLYDHWKGDKKPKMDGHFLCRPSRYWDVDLFLSSDNCAHAWLGIIEKLRKKAFAHSPIEAGNGKGFLL